MDTVHYYQNAFRGDVNRFMPATELPYFGHAWGAQASGLEKIVTARRPQFLLCLYFTVLADQAMYTHFRRDYASFAALTRYPKFCRGLGQFNMDPMRILTAPIGQGLVSDAEILGAAPDAMRLFVDEVRSFFRDHMPAISADAYLRALIYDPDVHIPLLLMVTDSTVRDSVRFGVYSALHAAVKTGAA